MMSTSTLNTTDETTEQAETAAADEPQKTTTTSGAEVKEGTVRATATRARSSWRRWSEAADKKNSTKVPSKSGYYILAAFYRGVVLIVGYLLVMVIAMTIIPLLGAWLHEQSGASQGQLTAVGTVAMWFMPLLFLVALLTAATLGVLRSMWRWSSRRIAVLHAARFPDTDQEAAATGSDTPTNSTPSTTNRKKNRKRSK